MLVAHRNGMSVSVGGWQNPYVTDGLVAMWDGEWNAGGGVHDATATTWMNLVTGETVSLPSGFTVGADCISVANANQSLVVSDYSGADFTVEYVFALADSNTGRECLFESVAANSAWCYKAAASVQDIWPSNSYALNLFSRTGNVGVRKHIASTWSNIYSSDNVGYDYLDGAQLPTNQPFIRGTPASLNGFRVGRSGYTTYQDINCIRIYNRALTAAEIAANHAIDKARFNLP